VFGERRSTVPERSQPWTVSVKAARTPRCQHCLNVTGLPGSIEVAGASPGRHVFWCARCFLERCALCGWEDPMAEQERTGTIRASFGG
jgi:hypothetical protein